MNDFLESNEIECELMEIPEYTHVTYGSRKLRRGKYHGSNFWDVPQFGSKRWVVATRIKLNFSDIEGIDADVVEIAQACVNFLNKPPLRKRYAKRSPSPKYGKLELHSAKLIDGKYGKYISALLVVRKRSHSQFWGKGKLI